MARSLNPDPRDDAPEAGPLSLADLRDVARLRKDLAGREEELRLLREQLGHALAGWHTEQQRALDLERRLTQAVSPAPAEPPEAEPAHVSEEENTGKNAGAAELDPGAGPQETASAEIAATQRTEAPETGAGLLAGLLNFLRD